MTTRPNHPAAGPHDAHDRLLIAARAAGDLTGRELAEADLLLAACDRCRGLLGDLRAIAAAMRHLPPAPRPAGLDFRLTADRAASLARGARWRRLLHSFGRRGNDVLRPLAATFTTLGLAGLLLAALPMLPLAGYGTGQATSAGGDAARDVTQATPGFEALPPSQPAAGTLGLKGQEPGADGPSNAAVPEAAVTGPRGPEPAGPEAAAGDVRAGDGRQGSSGLAPLVSLSAAFLGLGLGLFLLRRAAVRLG